MNSSRTSNAIEQAATERIRCLELENQQLRLALEVAANGKGEQTPGVISERRRDWGLRSILDEIPVMIGYWDADLRNRFCSRAYLTWFGVDPAHVHGMHIRDVLGEERYQLNLPYIEKALRGESQQCQRAIPAPDGKQIRHSLAHFIPDVVDGAVQGFYVVITETSALRDAHEALRASEERYRDVIEDQTELISRFGANGCFIFANQAFCRFFGKTFQELADQKWTPGCYSEDVARVEELLRSLRPENPTVVIESRVHSGTGQIRWMQFVARGFFGESGILLEVQLVGRDITDRIAAENALREVHAVLEQRVVERTEQLRRMGVEKAMAEERERQAIARDLHDGLGQLLHVVKVKLDMLGKQLPASAADAVDELNVLLADASRMTRSLTTQLSPPVLIKLGLPHALHWLAEEMHRLYGLSVDVSAEIGCQSLLPAYANILFRSVRELLINVAKHSGTKQASLEMTCSEEHLNLIVTDAGIGIADLDKALTGTPGFGIASIRERLTYMGGETEIVSAPGAGVRVRLQIPCNCCQP